MKKIFRSVNRFATIITVALLYINQGIFAQMTVTTANGLSPQTLVQNVLVGTGVTVSNVTYNGSSAPVTFNNFGAFTTGSTPTNLGFNSGLIMASGGVTGAVGPNNIGSFTLGVTPTSLSDPDLLALVPGSTLFDASVLEFDFIPVSDTIKFRYVFGSEEYNEWVGSQYNDIFAFFISGLNPLGPNYNKYNIALVPGTTTPITINNVNNGTTNTGPCSNCAYFTNNTGSSLQADGKTTVLTAWALVIPCTTYHMKLAISDRGDNAYDSWVWLEANSFSSPLTQITTNYAHPNISNNAVRGCNDAIVKLKFPNHATYPTPIPIIVQGNAVNGTDYVTIPNTIYLPTGSDSLLITVSPYNNPTDTSTKIVKLIIQTSTCGGYDTIIIHILPKPPLVANAFGDTTVCNINNPIGVVASGGFAPYHYTWSTGDTITSFPVSPMTTTWYHINVKDQCNQIAKDSVKITIYCKFANAGPDTTICGGDTATLHASGGIKYVWNTINNDTTAIVKVNPSTTTTYIVTVTNSSNVFTDKDTVVVFSYPNPTVTITPNPGIICLGDSIQLLASGASTYLWSSNIPPPKDTLHNPYVAPPINTLYTVTGTDIHGCKNTSSTNVNISPVPIPMISATPNPTLLTNPKVHFSELSGTGSTWYWETGDGFSYNQNDFYHTYNTLDTGRYLVKLVVTNSVGCIDSSTLWVYVIPDTKFFIPNSFTPDLSTNNTFRAYGSSVFNFEMMVYNRWGEQVFYSNNMDIGWDGNYKNAKAQSGAYVYFISFINTMNEKYQKTGTVTLLR